MTSGDDLWSDCVRNDYALVSGFRCAKRFFLSAVFSDCNWHNANFSVLTNQPTLWSSKFGALDLFY